MKINKLNMILTFTTLPIIVILCPNLSIGYLMLIGFLFGMVFPIFSMDNNKNDKDSLK